MTDWDRDVTYQHFGPIQCEARDLVFLQLINELRDEQGMPELTDQQFRNLLMNDTTHLPPYNWMDDPPGP